MRETATLAHIQKAVAPEFVALAERSVLKCEGKTRNLEAGGEGE